MTGFHRHECGTAAFPDGHDGPCDHRHAVLVLDPRQPDTLKTLQRALDDQPHPGLRALVHAVESLLAEAVS